jgi:hypothetical protein
VADSTHDTDADVIVSGREPRRRAPWPAGLVWLLVGVQAAALAVRRACTGSSRRARQCRFRPARRRALLHREIVRSGGMQAERADPAHACALGSQT